MIYGDLDEWQDRIAVTVPHQFDTTEVAALRLRRGQQHERIKAAFEKWKDDPTPIHEVVREEALALGRATIGAFWEDMNKRIESTLKGKLALTLPAPGARLVYDLCRILEEDYMVEDPFEQASKVAEYFQSPHIIQVPFVRLSAMLYASLARKAKAGRRTEPNEGTITDVTAIASLLPYCDAMFVDKEMATYLQEVPLREEVKKFGTKIFSLNSKTEFLTFLEDLENKAGKRHIALVEQIYGKDWLAPYVDLLAYLKERRRREGRQRE